MLEEKNIIRFDPFYFKNGNTPKPKYFIILKYTDNKTVIASLPTRRDSVPHDASISEGCLEIPEINLNCFVIPPNVEITESGTMFDFATFLYGHQLDDYTVESMKDIYPNEGSDFVILGKMKQEMFEKLIDCFKNSKSVKWKYRKLL